ncbi:MAG TPA: ammonium transporter [Candidatus Brocadiia bacterium]|nr:ammonium transporter [Candidatus Brocadiales bacterium]
MKKRQLWLAVSKANLIVPVVAIFLMATPALAGDPSGVKTYSDTLEGLQFAINFAWVLLCAFLVFNMQAGFAFLGAGFIRRKNTLNYLTMSYIDFCAGSFTFWLFGFSLMFGGSQLAPGLVNGNSFVGYSGFLLLGDSYDVQTAVTWLFQMMFAAAAATIVAGAVAERVKFQAYLIYTFLITGIVYPLYGHWMWGGGWLSILPFGTGAKDFAGSGVVHAIGGLIAFIGAWMVGPRIGKYENGKPVVIPGHNLVYVISGTLILLFGWFGFNAGSTMRVTDLRVSIIALNTFLAATMGALVMIYYTYFTTGKADMQMACNGTLAGCVAITASSAYVPPWAAVVIGIIAAFIMRGCVHFIETTLKVDDPVGAVSVHGANGLWGLLSVGVFADGTYQGVNGLIMGHVGQLFSQFIAAVTAMAWCFSLGLGIFVFIKYTIGIRATAEAELQGMDVVEHGTECYPGYR